MPATTCSRCRYGHRLTLCMRSYSPIKPSLEHERSCAHTALRKRCIGNEYCKCAPTGGAAHSRSHCIDQPPTTACAVSLHAGRCTLTALSMAYERSNAENGVLTLGACNKRRYASDMHLPEERAMLHWHTLQHSLPSPSKITFPLQGAHGPPCGTCTPPHVTRCTGFLPELAHLTTDWSQERLIWAYRLSSSTTCDLARPASYLCADQLGHRSFLKSNHGTVAALTQQLAA